jgi:serine/threonine protein kinase
LFLVFVVVDPTEIVAVDDLLANWMAPDVIRNKRFQQASDIYSLGTVLWEIIARQLPFEHLTQPEIRKLLLSGYRHPLPEIERGTALGSIIQRYVRFCSLVWIYSDEIDLVAGKMTQMIDPQPLK